MDQGDALSSHAPTGTASVETPAPVESSQTTDRCKEIERIKLNEKLMSEVKVYSGISLFLASFSKSMLMSVVDLGKLMLISNKKDFSIYDSTKRPESLKYPESFKASLVQAASAERKAFDSANRTVRIIGNDARRIPVIFRNVFRIIENPKNQFTVQHLRDNFEDVKKIASNCGPLCQKTSEEVTAVAKIFEEIQEHTAESAIKYAQLCKQREYDKQEAERKRDDLEKQFNQKQQQVKISKDHLHKFQMEYDEAIANMEQPIDASSSGGLLEKATRYVGIFPSGKSSTYSKMVALQKLAEVKEKLTKAQKEHQQLFDEETKLHNQQTENRVILASLENIGEEKIDYDQIKTLLSDVLKVLESYQKGWDDLDAFFRKIGGMVKQAIERSGELTDTMDQSTADASPMNDTIKNIYQLSYESVAFAEMIYAACTEYTRIADAHITPTFTRVVGYLNNDKLDNVESEIEELEEMAKTAGSEVEKEIKLIARKYEERQRTTKWELDKLSTDKRTAE